MSFSEDVGKRYRGLRLGGPAPRRGHRGRPRSPRRSRRAKATDKPTLIVARTHIGYGAPTLQDTGKAHGSPLGEDEIKGAKEFYDWPSQEPFFVPDGVYDHYKELVAERAKARAGVGGALTRTTTALAELERMRSQGAARRLGRTACSSSPPTRRAWPPARRPRRRSSGSAAGVPELVGGSRRPRRLDQHDHRRRRQRRRRRVRRAQPALRHPRARHGRDRQRPHAVAASAPTARRS